MVGCQNKTVGSTEMVVAEKHDGWKWYLFRHPRAGGAENDAPLREGHETGEANAKAAATLARAMLLHGAK